MLQEAIHSKKALRLGFATLNRLLAFHPCKCLIELTSLPKIPLRRGFWSQVSFASVPSFANYLGRQDCGIATNAPPATQQGPTESATTVHGPIAFQVVSVVKSSFFCLSRFFPAIFVPLWMPTHVPPHPSGQHGTQHGTQQRHGTLMLQWHQQSGGNAHTQLFSLSWGYHCFKCAMPLRLNLCGSALGMLRQLLHVCWVYMCFSDKSK